MTVFLPRDSGPREGAPERDPQGFAELQPAYLGAWRWRDARSLQLSPAEPWPVLALPSLRVKATTVRLVTLLEEPLATVPAKGAEGVLPVESVTLSFADPVDVTALAAVVAVARSGRDAPVRCALNFRQPIRFGTRAQVRLLQGFKVSITPLSTT